MNPKLKGEKGMKKISSIIGAIVLCSVFLCAFSVNVFAYSGALDTYSGWCGASGLTTSDSWLNDDGVFYVDHKITAAGGGGSAGSMEVSAKQKQWWGYEIKKTLTLTRTIGTYALTFTVPNGEYKLFFKAINNKDLRIDFNGTVYDDK